jgi:hypothetical protein
VQHVQEPPATFLEAPFEAESGVIYNGAGAEFGGNPLARVDID